MLKTETNRITSLTYFAEMKKSSINWIVWLVIFPILTDFINGELKLLAALTCSLYELGFPGALISFRKRLRFHDKTLIPLEYTQHDYQ